MMHSVEHQQVRDRLRQAHAYHTRKQRCSCGTSMKEHQFLSHVIDEAIEEASHVLHDHAHDHCDACETIYISGYNAGHDDGRRGYGNDHTQETTG